MADNTSHRVNDQIRISPVRVVGNDGEMLGVIPTPQAMQMAMEAGLDLVEVAPNVRPPVCRIMDYGKFKYEQHKKKKSNTGGKAAELKEIRLRPKTGDHDIEFKIKQARGFLEERHKVKLTVMFKGRENAHHERGRDVLDEVIKLLEDVAKVEKFPGMDGGRQMTAVVAPRAVTPVATAPAPAPAAATGTS